MSGGWRWIQAAIAVAVMVGVLLLATTEWAGP